VLLNLTSNPQLEAVMKCVSRLQSWKSFFSIADAYHQSDREIAEQVYEFGQIAKVCERLRPGQSGQVEFRGSWWTALCLDNVVLLPGASVRVIDRVELTLVVEPLATAQVQALRPKKRGEVAA
jgi:membrane protein implicated in regulation of membrane protease activity